MKKDKEWLKNEVIPMFDSSTVGRLHKLIDQMDEPEKVVLPQFVAIWLDMYKGNYQDVYDFIICLVESFGTRVPDEVSEYASINQDTMIKAYLFGYEVEREKRYRVVLPTGRLDSTLVAHTDGTGHFFSGEHRNDSWYKSYLTEAEIKEIDERYWAFAEEVTE